MKSLKFLATLTAMVASSALAATTDAIGFVTLTVPASSDISIGAPLHRSPVFMGAVQSVDTGTNTITVQGTPAWVANQFQYAAGTQPNTHYARIDTGTKEGMWATISSNDVNSITLTPVSGDDTSGIVAGDQLSVIPHWTPSTLISGISANVQLQVFRSAIAGTNQSASATLSYNVASTSWFQGLNAANDFVLNPGEGLVLRNNSASSLTVSIVGSVPMAKHRQMVRTLAGNKAQDQRVTYQGPIPEVIGNIITGFENGDQLLFFNNLAAGKNKAASATLSWNATASAWFQGLTNVSSTYVVEPGTGFIFRKKATATPQTFVWQDLQGYLQ